MDELKNIRNFNEFQNESLNEKLFVKEFGHLNEEALWGAIKALFSKVFGKIDKALADAIGNFTQKLDKSKSWDESVKYFNEALSVETKDMENSLGTVTGALGLRKVIGDNATIMFVQWLEMKNKYALDSCAPKVIFQNNPMFQYDKSDEFNNNILNSSNAVILQINKSISPPPFEEVALKADLDKSPEDINVVQGQEQKPEAKTQGQPVNPTNPPVQSTNTAAPSAPSTNPTNPPVPPANANASYNYKYSGYKINEEIEEIAASQPTPGQAPATATNQTATTPTAQQNQQPPTQQNQQQQNQQQQNQQKPIDILKEATKKYINDNFYQYSANKIKSIKAPAKIGAEDAMLALAKGSKATSLPQNLAKLLKSIINVQDKQTLLKIRDVLAVDMKKTPNDLKNEIPL